jgi:hypothetical protein
MRPICSRLQQASGKNVSVFLALFTTGREHGFAMLFEVHQPIGHGEVRHVEHHAGRLERGGIFAVRIDHDDMALGRRLADAVQDQRGTGRLAGTSRAEQREVLAKERVDVDAGADIASRENGADLNGGTAIARIDLAKIVRRRGIDQRARNRIAGDAAAEAVDAAGQAFFIAFAKKVDLGRDAARAFRILLLRADRCQKPATTDANLDLATHLSGERDRGIKILRTFVQAAKIKRDGRAGTGNFLNDANGFKGVFDARLPVASGDVLRTCRMCSIKTLRTHVRHHGTPQFT